MKVIAVYVHMKGRGKVADSADSGHTLISVTASFYKVLCAPPVER